MFAASDSSVIVRSEAIPSKPAQFAIHNSLFSFRFPKTLDVRRLTQYQPPSDNLQRHSW